MIKEIKSKSANDTTVNMLKEALERAENGDIQGLVMFGTTGDGEAFNQFNVSDKFMLLLAESRLVERDLIDLYADIRKNVHWDYCE